MIITDKVEMLIYKNTKNKNYYRDKGYIINDTTTYNLYGTRIDNVILSS